MSKSPLISVIVPVYNVEKYIKACLDSILAQTFTDFELILVDDGSVDSCPNICDEYAKKDNRIKVIHKENGGVSSARNIGIEEAVGEYILFVDCDDTWETDLLEQVVAVMGQKNDLVIFGMKQDWYLSDDTFMYSDADLGESGAIEELPRDIDTNRLFSVYNMASPCNKVYKKEIIEKNALSFCDTCVYLEDLKFNFDYLRYVSNISVLRNDLYHYRLFSDKKNILKRRFKEEFVNADELYASAMAYLDSKGVCVRDCSVIVGVGLSAYINELLARSENIDADELKTLLIKLNKNEGFCYLLKSAKGKFYSLIRFLRKFRAYGLQFKMIKKRKGNRG